MAVGSSFEKFWERVFVGIVAKAFSQDGEINFPHVNTQVFTSGCKEKFSIDQGANTGDFGRMGNQTHGIVRISIQRQFDDSNNFFFCGISQVLILVIVLFVSRI